MEKVIQTLRRKDGENRIPVLKLEIDYELQSLYDAMEANETSAVEQCKENLEQLRYEWLRLEA
ncbi:hypothetical protein [Salisediminibacterium halotolerans]|uniref:Uncharacterized protein n=1 Tax=Salisediminibacterium halotolerans TaxID=517425 RepID=A0A1H9PQN2_9BACI|nr:MULTISPECIES: hypothetical protein [Salisediminibacterium]RLJ74346.1 hypothetical protein BCL39_1634 [Actinophytocola xinjiangensis]RPE87561.1 hypothetical protein EDD67_1297 [Salisediminibacterium halotolerans]TWG35183.1 hypothetical protein BCL52_1631 [Salisediminibacterium halotolerans]SER50551.1 hypothetical protein SAMN05444126_1022 [Salisediminibacterium haloalkalitolerans]GEL08879.1 hypothetical protein SHA02_22950 [Salisediminibacterium halotolerans]